MKPMSAILIMIALSTISFNASATKVNIDTYMADQNGKNWFIRGWVDIDLWSVPPKVVHWDVNVLDPYKREWVHFVGHIVGGGTTASRETGTSVNNAELDLTTGYDTTIIDENGNPLGLGDFDQDIMQVLLYCLNHNCDE